MKILILFFLILWGNAFADWIQPPESTESGYPVPQPDKIPTLPSAHAAHPSYGIEWWYWIGHIDSLDGEKSFGFQSTVFRLKGDLQASPFAKFPAFGNQQIFMAHTALSDFTRGTYIHAERIYREGWQARASSDRLDIAVGGIEAEISDDSKIIKLSLVLPEGGFLDLEMLPTKPLVAFGDRDLSRKGEDPAAVSWYWTYPRLSISGILKRGDESIEVKGTGWMDHEISSSQLSGNLVGWDWTAIQLFDGSEVKAYRLRNEDGSADPWSAVYWIDKTGKLCNVYSDGFFWENDDDWESSITGNLYPTSVTISAIHPLTGKEMLYRLKPLIQDQEFVGNRVENAYWEGACDVFGSCGKIIGRAYLELAGYGSGLGNYLTK